MTEFFMEEKFLAIIQAVIKQHTPNALVWAYGSRVNGDAHSGSDLDLVVRDFRGDDCDIATLKEELSASNVPFLIDILEFNLLPVSFQQEIEKKYIVIYAAESAS